MTIQEWQGLAAGWDNSPYGSGPVPHSRYVMIGSGEFSFDPSLTNSVRNDWSFITLTVILTQASVVWVVDEVVAVSARRVGARSNLLPAQLYTTTVCFCLV